MRRGFVYLIAVLDWATQWVLLYIERWLKASIRMPDGTLTSRERRTPQGAVVSPILANLFLHYAFDRSMDEHHPDIPFERYADDVICHCRSEAQAAAVVEDAMRSLRSRVRCHISKQPNRSVQLPPKPENLCNRVARLLISHQANLSICMVSDDFLPAATGVGIHLQAICPHLVKINHQVSVITTRRPGQPSFEMWHGVSVYRIVTIKVLGFYQGMPSSAAIREIVSQVRPHLIHYHYVGIMLLRALNVAERLRLPKVYTYHMTEDHLTQPLPMRPFRRLIARQIVNCCNRTDLVIAVSQALASELPHRGIRTPIRYISNPVAFREDTSVEPVARDGTFVVMFAGRLDPEKNLPYLLRGFSKVLDSMPEAVLWLAGEGAQKTQLQNQCRDLRISNRVKFLGFVDHDVLRGYYAACDVFVLPSLVETQGLVAMEAMWFGKPLIVARSVVSAIELVEKGNGFIVDQSSDSDLVHRLLQLGSNSELRAIMGAAGRQMAEAFRPQVVVAALETAYTDTLRRLQPKSSWPAPKQT